MKQFLKKQIARRKFLGGMGAVAAAPLAPVTGGEMDLNSGMPAPMGIAVADEDKRWARERLSQLKKLTRKDRDIRKRYRYINGIHPEVAALRSASLQHKIRMTRIRHEEEVFRREMDELLHILSGGIM